MRLLAVPIAALVFTVGFLAACGASSGKHQGTRTVLTTITYGDHRTTTETVEVSGTTTRTVFILTATG